MGNLERGKISLNKLDYIHSSITPNQLHRLKRGDVILNTRNTHELVGKVAIWNDQLREAYFNSNLLRLEFKSDRVSSRRFANYRLNHPATLQGIKSLATGTTSVGAIYTRDLLGLALALPQPDEQRAISGALARLDNWIEAAEAEAAKLASVKAATMDALLTPTARLPGFTEEWERVRLGDLYDPLSTAAVARAAYVSGQGVACVHYGDIHVHYDGFVRMGQDHVAAVPMRLVRAASRLKSGDVLIADAAEDLDGVGKAIELVAPEACEVVGGLHVQALRPKANRIALGFSGYLFRQNAYREAVERGASGLKVFGISKSQLMTVEIFLPPTLAEQQAIAAVLSDLDSALAMARAVVTKARGVKAATMDALLSGRVRLPSFDPAARRAPSEAQGAA